MKNKNTAGILAFFLGGLGGHKFYLNNWVLGIVYASFCWTFIPAIIAFIEAIMLFSMSDENFNEKYNKDTILNINSSDEIGKLFKLKEMGAISNEEFEKRKSQLLK